MRKFVILVSFLQLLIVTSLSERTSVSLCLNAPNRKPVCVFLLDDSKDKDASSNSKSIKTVMDSQQDQFNKIKASLKDNSDTLSAINSRLADLNKAVSDLQKATFQKTDGYIGCFKDDRDRLLPYGLWKVGTSITLAKCREHCKGYKYLGLQGTIFCLCGNTVTNPKYPKIPDSNCDVPCPGEPNRMCGGGWKNSIYLVKP